MKHIFIILFMFVTTLAFSQTKVTGHIFAEVVEPVYLTTIYATTIKSDTVLIKKPVVATDRFLKSTTDVKEVLIKKKIQITLINYN